MRTSALYRNCKGLNSRRHWRHKTNMTSVHKFQRIQVAQWNKLTSVAVQLFECFVLIFLHWRSAFQRLIDSLIEGICWKSFIVKKFSVSFFSDQLKTHCYLGLYLHNESCRDYYFFVYIGWCRFQMFWTIHSKILYTILLFAI